MLSVGGTLMVREKLSYKEIEREKEREAGRAKVEGEKVKRDKIDKG